MPMKAPTFARFQKTALLLFGMAVAGWEIIINQVERPAVLVFLAMCLGIMPAANLDNVLRKTGGVFGQPPTPPAPPVADPDPVRSAAP